MEYGDNCQLPVSVAW